MSKWGGIKTFADEIFNAIEAAEGELKYEAAVADCTGTIEARLRRRIEPLLEAAKEVHCPTSTLTEINRLRRLQEEVDKWRK